MNYPLLLTTITAASFALQSCENPADKTTDATVSDAKEKVVSDAKEGQVRYEFTPDSKILFTGSKVTGSHSGGFKSFTGHFTIGKNGEPEGNDHKVIIDMASTFSDHEKLTEHLKNEDFFNVPKFPTSTFDVTSINKENDSNYKVTGNLTLHGVTKSISFPAEVTSKGDLVYLHTKFDINRQDFGIKYAGKKDDLIRDEVVLEFDLKAKAAK